jgi:Bacterial Ig-like domain (group 2)
MISVSNRKVVPALVAFVLPLLSLVACNSAYTGANSGTGTNYPILSDVTLRAGTTPSIAVAGTVLVDASAGYQVSATEIDYNDVTASAAWSSSDDTVATVSKGLVTGTGIGSATISASLNGKTGTTRVVVGQTATVSIARIGTGGLSLSVFPDQHFGASASYSDGSVLNLTGYATWSSSAPGVLKFYDDPYDYVHDVGEAVLLATGTTTITATLKTGELGSIDVTVLP